MSKEVDERVVSLQFNNKHFEQNVKTSMSTIDKLKQSLQFKNTSKSFEDLEKASGNAQKSFKELEYNACQAGFSLRDVWLKTSQVFEYQIAGRIVNAAKKITSALAIDPVTTGFQEYETQINAVQTILANTESKGTTIEDVNKALEELNKYADKTIYNFTEMTRNIGTFTAAGVDLDTSVTAIQGIANLAAVSGSTSQQASTAMYQLSQALSSGTVKLMDWNSVVNAGMGGQVFQDALKETARTHGVAIDDMITKQGSFRETLQEGWLTADILTETLSKFTMATEGCTEAEIEANRERLRSLGYTEEQIEGIFKLGNTATNAATKVKTFTQLWDVLKESAQSGWSQTWKLVVGDFEEAKALLTPFADTLTSLINKTSYIRNRIVQIALDFSTPWSSIIDKLSNIKKVANTIGDVTDKLNYFQDVVDRVWLGQFNNWGDNPDRRDLLKAAGYDPRVVQRLVDIGEATWQAGKVYQLTMEDVKEAHERFGLTFEASAEETEKLTEAFEELTYEQLKNAGLTDEEIALYRALEKEARRAGITIGELADEMSKNNGRDMLIESFKNIGKVIGDVGVIVKNSWVDIFNPPTNEEIGIRLYGIIRAIKEFTESLRLINDETGELSATGSKIQRIFKGIFAAIDIVLTVIGGPLRLAFKIATKVLSFFGYTLLDVAAIAGDMVVGFKNAIDAVFNFDKIIERVIPKIQGVFGVIRDWFAGLAQYKDSPKELAEAIVNGIGNAISYIGKLLVSAKDYIVGKCKEIGGNVTEGLNNGILSGASKVFQTIVEIGKIIIEKIKNVLGIHSPSVVMIGIGGFIIAGLVLGIRQGFPEVWNVIKELGGKFTEFLGRIDFGSIFTAAMTAAMVYSSIKFSNTISMFAEPLEGLGEFFEGLGKGLLHVGKGVKEIGKAQKYKAMAKVLTSFAIAVGVLVAAVFVLGKMDTNELKQGLISLAGIMVLIGVLCVAASKVNTKTVDVIKISGLLLGISLALTIMASAIKKLSFLNGNNVWPILLGTIAMVGGIYLLLLAFGKLTKGTMAKNIDKAAIVIAKISLTMLTLAFTIKLISGLDIVKLGKGLLAMSLFGAFVTALIFATKLAGPNINGLGDTILKLTIAMGMLVIVIKLIGTLNANEILAGLACISAFGVLIAGLIAATRLAGDKDIAKLGGLLMSISAAMILMAFTIRILSGLSTGDIVKGIACITIFGVLILALVYASKVGKEQDIIKASATILAMSIAISLMVLTSTLLGLVSIEKLAKGVVATSILCGMLALMVRQLKGANDVKGSIIAMSVSIALLVGAVVALCFLDPKQLAVATVSLSLILATFSLLIRSLSYIQTGEKTFKRSIGMLATLTGVVMVLGGVLALLSLVPNPNALIPVSAAIGTVLVSLAGAFAIINSSKTMSAEKLARTQTMLYSLTGVVAILGGILAVISFIPNPSSVIPIAAGLSMLLITLTGIMTALALFSTIPGVDMGKIATGIGGLMLMMVPLMALVAIIHFMPDISAGMKNMPGLLQVLTVLSALLLVTAGVGIIYAATGGLAMLGIVGLLAMLVPLMGLIAVIHFMPDVSTGLKNMPGLLQVLTSLTTLLVVTTGIGIIYAATGGLAMLGIVGLLGMLVPLMGLIAVLHFMPDVSAGMKNIYPIMDLLTIMSDILIRVSIFGPLAIMGVYAITALTAVIVAIGALATAVGALFGTFPALEEFLNKGLPILEQISLSIGTVIGNFIKGVATAVMSGLPEIGSYLTAFIDNASGFIAGVKMVDASVLTGTGLLTGAILVLTAANFISGISEFLRGGSSFADVGTQLSDFMTNAEAFITGASKMTADSTSGIKNLAEAILIITAADIISGIASFLTGNSSLSEFGSKLGGLGTGLRDFSDNLGTFTEEQANTVTCASNAIKAIAEAAKTLPNEGGWLGAIVGENNIEAFGARLPQLGTHLKGFVANLGTFTEDQVNTVTCAANAVKVIAEAASELPNEGGWLAGIVGDNSISTFGSRLPQLALDLNGFVGNLGTFTEDQVKTVGCAGDAILKLAKVADSIPNEGGWLAGIVGDNSISTFGGYLPDLGSDLSAFVTNLGTFTDSQVNTVKSGVYAIQSFAQLANSDIKGFATNVSSFGGKLGNFAKNIVEFCNGMPDSELLDSAEKGIYTLINTVRNIVSVDTEPITTFSASLTQLASEGANGFITAFTDSEEGVKDTVESFIASASRTLNDSKSKVYKGFHKAGANAVNGFVDGINENAYKAKSAAADMAKAAENAAKAELDEHSPSKKFEAIGAYVVEGFGNGISDNLGIVKDSGTSMGTTVLNAVQKCLGIHSPSVVMNKQGQWIVQGLADGIDSKTSAEDAAEKKAHNIATAFQNELDKNNLDMSTLDKDLELWMLTEGEFATDAGKNIKQLETLESKLKSQKKNVKLAYDEYQETLKYQAQLGKDGAEKTQEALNKYKDECIEQKNLANEIEDIEKSITNAVLNQTSHDTQVSELRISRLNSLDSDEIDAATRDNKVLEEYKNILDDKKTELQYAQNKWMQIKADKLEDTEAGKAAELEYHNALNDYEDAEDNVNKQEELIFNKRIQNIEDSISRRNTELELWETLYGDKATDEERDAKYLEVLSGNAEDKAKAALEEEKKYNKLLEDGFIPTSEEAEVQWDKWQDALIEEGKAKKAVTDYLKDSKERENDQLRDAYDLASDNANLQYQIWEKTEGRDATSAEKDAKKLAMLSQQASSQAGMYELAKQEWYDAVNEYGKNSEEANTAYNNYLREYYNLVSLQSDILDLDEKNRKREERQKNAKNDYLEYMKKYEKYYLDHGMTLKELEKDARLVTGYDPSNPVKSSISSATTAMENLDSNQQYQNLVDGFSNMGTSYITAVSDGIEDSTPGMTTAMNTAIANCLNAISATKKLWIDSGVNVVQGFIKGIKSQSMSAVMAAADLCQAVITAVKAAFDEHSPSRVFAEIGMYAGMGLANGLTDSAYMSEDAAEEMASRTIDSLKSTITRISDMINDDIDAEPTIRPVLDLSDVESKASKLNSMLSRTQAMRINSEMSRDGSDRIQNGTNSPKSGDTYQFTQINNSPKALSRAEIYRQTNNQFSAFKRTVKA